MIRQRMQPMLISSASFPCRAQYQLICEAKLAVERILLNPVEAAVDEQELVAVH